MFLDSLNGGAGSTGKLPSSVVELEIMGRERIERLIHWRTYKRFQRMNGFTRDHYEYWVPLFERFSADDLEGFLKMGIASDDTQETLFMLRAIAEKRGITS